MSDLKALAEAATDIRSTRYAGYFVGDDGSVWSSWSWRGASWRRLATFSNSHGYPAFKAKTPTGVVKGLVHKLVCEAFHGPKPTSGHQVRHLNGDRSDCRAANLAWGTAKENAQDRTAHGHCRSAENGRKGAAKRKGRSPVCQRGHDKAGRINCEQCRRERRARQRNEALS